MDAIMLEWRYYFAGNYCVECYLLHFRLFLFFDGNGGNDIMLTRADYLAFEGSVVKNRMHLLFLFGEIERVNGLDRGNQAFWEKKI